MSELIRTTTVGGGKPAFSLVLHTWSQDLGLHIHLHAIMACGVLGQDQWHTPARKPDYLFPTRALSKVWRAKFMAHLRQSTRTAEQPAQALDLAMDTQQRQALWKKDWVVYAKTPLGGAAQVLQYLSRYTHRTAIGNERILSLQGDEVVISARAKRSKGKAGEQGKKRALRIRGPDFIGRFMPHVLPGGLKRIRHYGLLANPNGARLDQAKAALHMPASNPQALLSAQDFMARVAQVNIHQCPVCQQGRMGVVQTLSGAKRLPDPFEGGARKANSRAPPGQGP